MRVTTRRGLQGSAGRRIRAAVRLAWMALAVLVARGVFFAPVLMAQLSPVDQQPRIVRAEPALRSTTVLQEVLQWLVLRSPIIFSGEVLPADGPTRSTIPVDVTSIRVDHAVRGVHSGEIFSLRQWRGAGGITLSPHQRVILFLHQPNGAGITSSAAGGFGLFPLGGGDLVDLRSLAVLERQIAPRFRTDPVRASLSSVTPPGGTVWQTLPVNLPAQQFMGILEELARAQTPWWKKRTPAEAANAP